MGYYHEWGDESFDWEGLNDAGQFLSRYLVRYGRIGCYYKEKYGTLRVTIFWACQLHSLIYPSYIYSQFPEWLWKLDCFYLQKIGEKIRLWSILRKYQRFIYRRGYKLTIKKWPHLKEEILIDADWDDYLEGL